MEFDRAGYFAAFTLCIMVSVSMASVSRLSHRPTRHRQHSMPGTRGQREATMSTRKPGN